MESQLNDFSLPDFTDTGQWRLLISIASGGMCAVLRHAEDSAVRPTLLFRKSWSEEEGNLLNRVETAVYDHPRLLEDFATEIIISTPKSLWVPTQDLEEEGAEETLFGSIYPSLPEDILTDYHDDVACLYTLTPGLAGFISRTLPGSRIRCQLSPMVERYRRQTSDLPRIYVAISGNEVDVVAFEDKRLMCAVTYPWKAIADIAYRIFLIADAFNLDPQNLDIRIAGPKDQKSELIEMLRSMTGFAVALQSPPGMTELGLNLGTSLALSRD